MHYDLVCPEWTLTGRLAALDDFRNWLIREATDVVQLYAADTATGVTLPAQQLIGFTRVDLEPGASTTVSFVIPLSVLAYTGLSGELLMHWTISATGSSVPPRDNASSPNLRYLNCSGGGGVQRSIAAGRWCAFADRVEHHSADGDTLLCDDDVAVGTARDDASMS